MKGKQLSLQEVLKLEDRCKVWVEDASDIFESDLYIYDKENIRVNLLTKESIYGYDLTTIGDFCGRIKFYEWIDGVKSINIFGTKDGTSGEYYNKLILHNLVTEILNLRSLDLTDENIEMIITEFSWQCKWDEL